MAATLPALGTLGVADGDFGITFAPAKDDAGRTALAVATVTPGSPADKVGVRVGDHFPENASLVDRIAATSSARPGVSRTFEFERNGVPHPVTLVALAGRQFVPDNPFSRIFIWLRVPQSIVLAAVAVLLILRVPSKMTWGLALFLYNIGPLTVGLRYVGALVGPVQEQLIGSAVDAIYISGHVGALVFAQRFPRNEVSGNVAKWIDACAWPATIVFILFSSIGTLAKTLYVNSSALDFALTTMSRFLTFLPFAAAAVLIATLLHATGVERRRLQWVIIGVAIGCIAQPINAWISFMHFPGGAYAARVFGMSVIVVPFFVAYGVLRHRVLDVGFVLNRATIYAAVAGALVAVLGLVKLLAGAYVKGSFASTLQVLTAIGLGLSTQRLYKFADWLVDRYFFPNQHATEKRLKLLGDGLKYASTTDVVAGALTSEPAEALNLGSAAVFRRLSDGSYVRRMAVGWNDRDVSAIPVHDPLTLYFEGTDTQLGLRSLLANRAGFPPGPAAPEHGFPLMASRQLAGFVLYSDHQDGTALDPDEISMLDKLVKAAGDAYDPLLRIKTAVRQAVSEKGG